MNKIIGSSKGETLMESVASLLILSILLLAVTIMIQTSLRMTSASVKDAEETQAAINAVIQRNYSSSEVAALTFTASGIAATHQATVNKDGGLLAFVPQ